MRTANPYSTGSPEPSAEAGAPEGADFAVEDLKQVACMLAYCGRGPEQTRMPGDACECVGVFVVDLSDEKALVILRGRKELR